MTLLLTLIVAQATYEERARAIDEAIVAERLRVASKFEEIRAWGWAREEYRKVLRLAPDSEVARKLSGPEALPLANVKGLPAQQYHELTGEVAKVAATKHAELGRWCKDDGDPDEAITHWRWTLLYSPAHAEAMTALGLVGSGASARDATWKDMPWKRPLEKVDAGDRVEKESALETAWKVKTLKRKSREVEWEALGLSEGHFTRVIRQANVVVDFMRIVLGDDKVLPSVKRFLLLTDHSRFRAYVNEFSGEGEPRKAGLRATTGFYNTTLRERVDRADEEGPRHEHVAIYHASKYMLYTFSRGRPAPWFAEGTANACEILFRGEATVFSSSIPTGTETGEFERKSWQDSSKWDSQLRAAVLSAKDHSIDELVGVQLNAMTPSHAAKCASLARFLMLRQPHLFRSLALSFRDEGVTPRAGVEKALGFTLEELDEFWRRWIVAH